MFGSIWRVIFRQQCGYAYESAGGDDFHDAPWGSETLFRHRARHRHSGGHRHRHGPSLHQKLEENMHEDPWSSRSADFESEELLLLPPTAEPATIRIKTVGPSGADMQGLHNSRQVHKGGRPSRKAEGGEAEGFCRLVSFSTTDDSEACGICRAGGVSESSDFGGPSGCRQGNDGGRSA